VSKPRGTQPDDKDEDGVTQADILHWVRSFIWSGEYDAEEVALLIGFRYETNGVGHDS
jgi:hypothetical protein